MNLSPKSTNSLILRIEAIAFVSIIAFFAFFYINSIDTPLEQLESPTEEINYIPEDDPSRARDNEGDTFSIVAYDPNTGEIGGAGCSCFSGTIDFLSDPIRDPSTGTLLGAIHTQAAYNGTNQAAARTRMEAGDTPQQIIDWLVANDPGSGSIGSRQYGIVGIDGGGTIRTAGFTGATNGNWAGDIQGVDATTGMHYSIQGNILDTSTGGSGRDDILDDMEAGFVNTTGSLADKLMAALQGAKRVGGDNRCTGSGISGRAAFIKVLLPGDPNDSSPSIDISLYPNIAWIEPIDELQCSYDAAYPPPTCRETVNTYPYTMDFEEYIWLKDNNNCGPANSTNSWIRTRHSTPTTNTGPSGANQGEMYMFVEADQGTNDSAQMTSPCFEIQTGQTTTMNFDYHMFGSSMGTLDLSVNDGGGWTSLWSLTGNQGNSWTNQQIDLSPYAGSTIRLRFNGTTSSGTTSDMALDNIVITAVPVFCDSEGNTSTNRGITNVTINTINNSDGPAKDVGYEDFTSISTDLEQGLSYDLNVSVNTDGNNTVFAKAWIDWNNNSDFTDPGEEYDLGSATNTGSGTTSLSPLSISVDGAATLGTKRLRISAKNGTAPTSCETGFDGEVEDYSINIIPPVVPVSCTTTISSFPYAESFESGLGVWLQAGGDDGNWIAQTGGTPSNGTGPSSASDGSTYLYIEASSNGTTGEIGQNATAILEGPCFELSAFSNVQFEFDYHTFGTAIGSIEVEGSVEEGVWFNLFTTPGVSSNTWVTETVDLSAYTDDMKIRFLGNTGTTFSSDLAIDNINVTGTPNGGCAGSAKIWDGSVWSGGTAPNATNTVTIDGNYDTAIHGDITGCTLNVNSGRTLTIRGGNFVQLNGNIVVDGTLIVEHEGSVVQTDANPMVINNGTINVQQTTPNLASRDFMILGSPMTGETRGSVWSSAFLVLNAITANFVPHPDVEAQFPGAENFADDNNNFWNIYGAGGSVNPGEGYLVRPQAGFGQPGGVFNYTYDDGTLNTGDITFNVGYNTPGPTSADNKNASPNALANPYPSAIFADDFINANAMIDEVFFWEHLTPPSPNLPGAGSMNFSMEDISMYNLSGGVGAGNPEVIATRPNGFIATGQGFGIKATAAGTATFTNAMRRTTGNNTLRNQSEKDRVWIQVVNAQYEMGGTALVAFNENATEAVDNGYDSRRLATIVSLYSHLPDGSEQLGIQTREAFGSGIKVPMGFSTQLE
ncbi:MAG: DUF1028 domain-containing protein, partial [Bacteroidota bacterium]